MRCCRCQQLGDYSKQNQCKIEKGFLTRLTGIWPCFVLSQISHKFSSFYLLEAARPSFEAEVRAKQKVMRKTRAMLDSGKSEYQLVFKASHCPRCQHDETVSSQEQISRPPLSKSLCQSLSYMFALSSRNDILG